MDNDYVFEQIPEDSGRWGGNAVGELIIRLRRLDEQGIKPDYIVPTPRYWDTDGYIIIYKKKD